MSAAPQSKPSPGVRGKRWTPDLGLSGFAPRLTPEEKFARRWCPARGGGPPAFSDAFSGPGRMFLGLRPRGIGGRWGMIRWGWGGWPGACFVARASPPSRARAARARRRFCASRCCAPRRPCSRAAAPYSRNAAALLCPRPPQQQGPTLGPRVWARISAELWDPVADFAPEAAPQCRHRPRRGIGWRRVALRGVALRVKVLGVASPSRPSSADVISRPDTLGVNLGTEPAQAAFGCE